MKDPRTDSDSEGIPRGTQSGRRDEERPTSVWAEQGKYLGYGMNLALMTLLSFFLGLWLDGKLGSTPWLALGGAFFGGVVGFYNLYAHVILEPNSRAKEDEPTRGESD